MKLNPLILITIVSVLLTSASRAQGQGTAFTYQGRLNDSGTPASGIYDLRFTIYDSTNDPGVVIAGPLINLATAVSNGLFTVTLNFGAGVFTGADRWLQIGVQTNGGSAFTNLSLRQKLGPTPYAIMAGNVASGGLAAGTYGNAVTFSNSANSFTGNGAGLTSLNASNLASGTVPDARLAANVARTNAVWLLNGNSGTTPGTHFLGTTDNQPLEVKINGLRVLRLEPTGDSESDTGTLPDGAPNVIAGAPNNFVAPGVVGATIAGGGATNFNAVARPNSIAGDYATIGGGLFNTIQPASGATIAGGTRNGIGPSSRSSAIGGGWFNGIANNSQYGTIAGATGTRSAHSPLTARLEAARATPSWTPRGLTPSRAVPGTSLVRVPLIVRLAGVELTASRTQSTAPLRGDFRMTSMPTPITAQFPEERSTKLRTTRWLPPSRGDRITRSAPTQVTA